MASAQLENGYTPIANELVEALARVNLPNYEWRVLWAIWRFTYGWSKKVDRISYTEFEGLTGIARWHLPRTIASLEARNMITVTRLGDKRSCSYAFQKDSDEWLSPDKVTVRSSITQPGESITQPGDESITQRGEHNNKKTITKTTVDFDLFWTEYPKKQAKQDARKAFAKLKPDAALLEIIMASLRERKTTHDWQKDNGQYVPNAATYLNGKRWEDEVEERKEADVRKPNYAN